jgi:hypothetical protein
LPGAGNFQNPNLNAPVLRTALAALVVGNRILFTESNNRDSIQRNVLADKISLNAFRASLAQSDIVLFGAGVVCEALDFDHVAVRWVPISPAILSNALLAWPLSADEFTVKVTDSFAVSV